MTTTATAKVQIESVSDIRKKLKHFCALFSVERDEVEIRYTGYFFSVKGAKSEYVQDQAITSDLKHVDFHQYNGLKVNFKIDTFKKRGTAFVTFVHYPK